MLICLSVLASCKTAVVGMQQHPTFTYDTVVKSKFMVGGVVSAVSPLDDITRVRFSDLMVRTFTEEKSELAISRAGFLINALGHESFEKILDRYRETGVLDEHDATQIRHAFPDARYLMFVRIEQDHVSQSHDETESDVADSEKDRKEGEFEHVRVDVSLTTMREMGATLSIYGILHMYFTV